MESKDRSKLTGAEWYFYKDPVNDAWYGILLSICRARDVSWAAITEVERAIIEADARSSYEIWKQNYKSLNDLRNLKPNWDGEGGRPFGKKFIDELAELISYLPIQPDIGATGRGSVDMEYGSMKDERYINFEIFERDRSVKLYAVDHDERIEKMIAISDIKEVVFDYYREAMKDNTQDNKQDSQPEAVTMDK